MLRPQLLRNSQGFTLIEILIAMGILIIVLYAWIGGMVSLKKTSRDSLVLSASSRQVNDIAENIKMGLENYQVNFNYTNGKVIALDVSKLPMAWDTGIMTTRAECPGCAGTYGYIIQPMERFRGLYVVTLRLTHIDWIAKGEDFRDYTFVVSAK